MVNPASEPTEQPPANPEEWTTEQWLDWLKATDEDVLAPADTPPVTRMGRITHSPEGQVLGQAMIGLSNAIYGPKEEGVVIVAVGDSEPEEDEPFTVHLDPDHPERSSVVIRTVVQPPS